MQNTINVSEYIIALPVKKGLRIAVAADVHANKRCRDFIGIIEKQCPDVIFIPGDLCHTSDNYKVPIEFLKNAVQIAPVYYTFGNHERNADESVFNIDGVHVLNNKAERFGEVLIGGLRSGFTGQRETPFAKTPEPNLDFLNYFLSLSGVKLLLCHHPEYYPKYLCDKNIDLIFAGHAHGGQWRLFGKGLFAPGQGLFPKYTSGIIDNKLIISPGLANTVPLPRLFNPPTLVVANIVPESDFNI